MSSAVRARAVVRARWEDGKTRLTTLRSDPPVTLRATAGAVYLAASAAGPLGGDAVDVEVDVGGGAAIDVRTVAATLVLPGPTGAPSTSDYSISVGGAGRLRWLPEQTVAVRGCDHRAVTRIDLAAGAGLVWREELILGRHHEEEGSVLQRLEIDRAGAPLIRTEHALGPRWPGSVGPAGSAGHRAVGTLVVMGPAAVDVAGRVAVPGAGAHIACAELAPDAVVVWGVASTATALRSMLDQALEQ